MTTAIKTKKASIRWDKTNKVTACDYGDKDEWGKAIWYDEEGKAYELIFARAAREYTFLPYPAYDKK
jgi:hypothetical protein